MIIQAKQESSYILMKGIDSLGFIITDPESVTENNFKILLRDIHVESIEMNFLMQRQSKGDS